MWANVVVVHACCTWGFGLVMLVVARGSWLVWIGPELVGERGRCGVGLKDVASFLCLSLKPLRKFLSLEPSLQDLSLEPRLPWWHLDVTRGWLSCGLPSGLACSRGVRLRPWETTGNRQAFKEKFQKVAELNSAPGKSREQKSTIRSFNGPPNQSTGKLHTHNWHIPAHACNIPSSITVRDITSW